MSNPRDLLLAAEAWRIVSEDPFASHGNVEFARDTASGDPILRIAKGNPGSGVNYRGPVPTMNYEVTAEARRVDGDDFFYGLTFSIRDQYATLIIGGWGGGVWGVSNLDGMSAVENETTGYQPFEQNRWYKITLRVADDRTTVHLDGKKIFGFATPDHQYSVWPQQATMIPLGIATWKTGAEIRHLTLQNV